MNSVSIEGTKKVDEDDVEEKLATAPSPKFLGLFRGVVYDYSIFSPRTLESDLERVERVYRAHGYYDAKARAGRYEYVSPQHVKVTIEVEEGEPTRVESLAITGLESVPKPVADAALAATKLHLHSIFDEDRYAQGEDAIKKQLTDRGYAFAKVTRRATVDLPARRAEVAYDVVPGKPCVFGAITIEGLAGLPETPVRRALDIQPGQKYSTDDMDVSRIAVLDLGAFTNVDIQPDLTTEPTGDVPAVPVTVRLEAGKMRALRLGGGVELDLIRTDVHGEIGWEHHNFLGGFRHFTVDLKPGVVLYPTRIPSFQAPKSLLPEEKFRAELAQPAFLESRTLGKVSTELNVFPVLLSPDVDPNATVVGYYENKESLGVSRQYWKLFTSLSYNFQFNQPFAYLGPLDPALSGVMLSYVDLLTQLDWRNDKVKPHKGFFVGNELQLAGGPLFGNAKDIRVQPEIRGYVPTTKHTTIALRGSVGFLFPANYGKTVPSNATSGAPPDGTSRADWVKDEQITYFRAFYSGGPNSNRGYPLRGVGPHGVIPFFNPTIQARQLQESCNPADPAYDEVRCAQPLGGFTLWEGSLEFRFQATKELEAALFCDASDVSPKQVDLRFDYLHLSCGVGARYDTPVGPIRLDLGYRIPGLQIVGKSAATVARIDGDPGTIFGVPIAVALGIGEPF